MPRQPHRPDQLRQLQALTDAALSHLELDALLAALLDRTREALRVDTAAILLLDDATNELVTRAAVGLEDEVAQGIRIPVGHGFAGRIAAEGRPVILDDVDRADVLNPVLRQKGIKSMLGVPLAVEEKTLGVLHVGCLSHRAFTENDVELLQLAADRAAIGIEHARLFAAEQTARRRMLDIQAVTDAALAFLEVDELLETLLPRVRDILGADTCAVLLKDPATNELVARSAVGIEEEVEQGVRIPIGGGFAGRIAAERRPVILDDVDHAHVLNPILREKGIKSMLGVPLIAAGEAIGVLHVGTLRHRRFTRSDVELLQLGADRAAIAIEHARLFEAERAARERIEHVQAVTDAALAHLDVETLLEVLLPRIRSILRADTCAVLLLDEETNELVATSAAGFEEEVEAGIRVPLGKGFAGRIAAQQRTRILDDVDSADVVNPLLRQKGIKSMLGVPLVVRGRSIGVLHVGTLYHHKFAKSDVELLQLVGERVAIAVERAQLHEETVLLDQMKLNFVAIASHELRTPATSVYGVFATLVERGDELSPELHEQLLGVGYEQATRMRRLLEELLDLSRLDSHAIALDPKPVVLRSALTEIVNHAVAEDVPVELDVPSDLAVVVDPLVLDRVVSNLVINAQRYGAPPITIAAEQKDRHLRIRVEDHGAGVPSDLVPRLFDRFARGDDTSGSGLGLAIARAYARAHGGDLIYHPGAGGARFELVVPQQT
ncbi:MAG TPA: GAF domain-containing protein [Gaiellaceae bacterium]